MENNCAVGVLTSPNGKQTNFSIEAKNDEDLGKRLDFFLRNGYNVSVREWCCIER